MSGRIFAEAGGDLKDVLPVLQAHRCFPSRASGQDQSLGFVLEKLSEPSSCIIAVDLWYGALANIRRQKSLGLKVKLGLRP
jgi:single-stranded DNA-specific DHH superfamily exonuclease